MARRWRRREAVPAEARSLSDAARESGRLRAAVRNGGQSLYRASKDCGIPYATLHRFMAGKPAAFSSHRRPHRPPAQPASVIVCVPSFRVTRMIVYRFTLPAALEMAYDPAQQGFAVG